MYGILKKWDSSLYALDSILKSIVKPQTPNSTSEINKDSKIAFFVSQKTDQSATTVLGT